MKRIIWDWNGTLFNDVDLCFGCINRLLKNHGYKPLKDIDAYRSVFGFPIIDYYKKAGFDFEKDPFDLLAKEYMDDYQSKSYDCKLQNDAIEAMEYVINHSMHQDILSASLYENLMNQIVLFPIQSYVDSIWGIQDIYAKSKMDIARQLKETYKEDTLYFIGDSIHDYEVSKEMQANCILVCTGHQSKERLERTGCIVKDTLMEAVINIYETD
ncbi:MAG: HAD hydrolase-like protein [Holdemanella sp.]|nr:HAD hydrolase-like protein [Holdemanella sp.]